MNRLLPFCMLLFLVASSFSLQADSGIFQTFVVYDLDAGGNTFLAGGINEESQPTYAGTDFGTPMSLVLNGGEVKTFKNGLSDVFGAEIYYRVYKQGTTPGSFVEIGLPFGLNLGDGRQTWQKADSNIDVLALADDGDGTYVLEVYWRARSSDGNHFDSNNGNNFQGTFEVNAAPVEMARFFGAAKDNAVQLEWMTYSEVNNDYFLVERSLDSKNWTNLDKVPGHGTTDQGQQYRYIDLTVTKGLLYYRLKQVDFDGQFEYSDVIAISVAEKVDLSASPNPIRARSLVSWTADLKGSGLLEVWQANGQRIERLDVDLERQQIEILTQDWPQGMYLVRLLNDQQEVLTQQRLIKL